MALLSLQAFKTKWAALTGRFKNNNTFDIAEKDYREFAEDLADSLFDPVERIQARLEKLEAPIPAPVEGLKWNVFPKTSVEGQDVKVTIGEAQFDAATVPFEAKTAKSAVPNPPAGWGTRVDILAAAEDGSWVYIYGEEPGVTPPLVHPDGSNVPLLFTAYLFWTSEGGEVEEPVVLVKVIEFNGADYFPDQYGKLRLPAVTPGDGGTGGGTVVSVNDQLPDANKNVMIGAEHIDATINDTTWWATVKIKVKGAIDRLANEIKLLQAWRNKFGEDVEQNPTYNDIRLLRTGDAPAIGGTDLTSMTVGQTNLFTVQKQADGSAKFSAGIEQIDKLAANSLASLLADDKAWVGFRIELIGVNTDGQLGYNSQELHAGRRGYDCISSSANNAVWLRTTKVDSLDPANAYDATIIAQLESDTGWVSNVKQLTVKSVKGDEYTNETSGYLYVCFSDDNKWRRVSEPAAETMRIDKTGGYINLCNALEAHDFATTAYDAAVLAEGDEKGGEGQLYYVEATRSLFKCVKKVNGKILWEKLR